MNGKSPYLVGISGGSASGKTSFITDIKNRFSERSLSVISQDNYYKPIEEQCRDDSKQVNFDLPQAIDHQKFSGDLKKLHNGESVKLKTYTFNNANAESTDLVIEPAEIIIVEGIFIFHFEDIACELDLSVFIDANEEIKFQRRLKRDKEERGIQEDLIVYQWLNHVQPAYQKYLLPHRDSCDLIITNNISYSRSLNIISDHLNAYLDRKQ